MGRFKDNVRRAFVQGVSPRKLALTCALGIVIGILPLVWGTTLLCAALACLLRLNQAAIQAANYLAWPLQIALFVPFYNLGARIFPWKPALSSGVPVVFIATLKALGAWLLVAPLPAVLLYPFLLPVMKVRNHPKRPGGNDPWISSTSCWSATSLSC